jgi:hypothetical protein
MYIVIVIPVRLAPLRKAADFLDQTLTAYIQNRKLKYLCIRHVGMWEETLDLSCYNPPTLSVLPYGRGLG